MPTEDLMAVDNTAQRVIEMPFRSDEDFWRVRNLLIETHPITPTGFNWEVRRWDGWRFYAADPTWDPRWEKQVRLWVTEEGSLVGAVHHEGTGHAHLELHPGYRHIEEDMIAWAEEHLAKPTEDGQWRQLITFVFDYDSPRRSILEKRGYERTSDGGVTRRLRFGNKSYPKPSIADGYTLRTTRPEDDTDCQRIAVLLNAAFNRDFHVAGEFRSFALHAPCFRNDLDLVAVAPDGSFAAYVGAPYNEANRYGVFEPVCTHPGHQRRGLARSLMLEALHRLKALGAADVYVGTGDRIAANRLYDSIGFTEVQKGCNWRKVF
jgi:ribosomal protein S18 acetylase RimI-like enzyme